MTSPTRFKALIACAATALVSGCATVGPNFKSPAASTVQSYPMAGDAPASEAAIGDRLAGDCRGRGADGEMRGSRRRDGDAGAAAD